MSEYPEHDKLAQHATLYKQLQDFIQWLKAGKLTITAIDRSTRARPAPELLLLYLGVDGEALEREKAAQHDAQVRQDRQHLKFAADIVGQTVWWKVKSLSPLNKSGHTPAEGIVLTGRYPNFVRVRRGKREFWAQLATRKELEITGPRANPKRVCLGSAPTKTLI